VKPYQPAISDNEDED